MSKGYQVYFKSGSYFLTFQVVGHSFTYQKMAYNHENPVRSGFVNEVENWMYSNRQNCSELESLLEIDLAEI